jgi:hypothetical protein
MSFGNRVVKVVKVIGGSHYVTLIALFTLSIIFNTKAQEAKQLNLPKYDRPAFQFGFMLGMNISNVVIEKIPDFSYRDTAYTVQSDGQSGLNLGIVATKQFGSYFDLRFTPTLSFTQRNLVYTLSYLDTSLHRIVAFNETKPVESTYLEFPFDLKYKSKRLNNFRTYVFAGGKYAIDMVSQAQVQAKDKELVKLNRIDYGYQVGVGFDFFLEYFKFGIEMKMYTGIPNLLVYDNRYVYSAVLDKLQNKTFTVSLYFEGGKN